MKKIIVVEFPDDFEFPETMDAERAHSKCYKCLIMAENDGIEYCFVTDSSNDPCPFYGGADEATLIKK